MIKLLIIIIVKTSQILTFALKFLIIVILSISISFALSIPFFNLSDFIFIDKSFIYLI